MKSQNGKDGQKLLRILMLHGYRQNELLFKDRTGGLRKHLKNYAEFVYCQAPLDVPKLESSEKTEETQDFEHQKEKGWFLKSCDRERAKQNADFNNTLDHLNDIFKLKGPFDGVWGFSQGATIAILCSFLHYNLDLSNRKHINFKFAIIAATCKSFEPEHDIYYDLNKKFYVPSLHIIGKTDKLVPYEKSIELTEYFVGPKVYIHELGHFIPAKRDSSNVYLEFLKDMIERI